MCRAMAGSWLRNGEELVVQPAGATCVAEARCLRNKARVLAQPAVISCTAKPHLLGISFCKGLFPGFIDTCSPENNLCTIINI